MWPCRLVVVANCGMPYFWPPEQLPDTSWIDVTWSDAMLPCELAPEDMLPVEPAVDPAAVEPVVEPAVEDELPAFSIVPRTSTFLFRYLSRSSLADACSLSPLLHWLDIELVPVVPAVLPVVELELLPSATLVRMN